MAALEVDALSCRLRGHQDLDPAVPELLLRVQPGTRLVTRTRPHAAVDASHSELPGLQALHQVVERVPELGEDQELLVRIVEESLLLQDVLETAQLCLGPRSLDGLRPFGERLKFSDLLADILGVAGQRDRLQHAFQPLSLVIFQLFHLLPVGEVGRCRPRQVLGLLQSILQSPGPVLQRAAHGVGAGGETTLVQRHQEAHGPSPPVVALRRCPGALTLNEACDFPVQIELISVDVEVGCVGDPLREHRLRSPGPVRLMFREVDHRLLGPPQVEGRPSPFHRLSDGLHVGIDVLVEELQEEGEIVRVALVGRGCQQQHVVRAVAQELPEPVALALVRLVARRHAVGLVDDHQVPAYLPQTRKDVLALGEVKRGNHMFLAQPLVDAELVANVSAFQHQELLIELLLQFSLPLEGQVRGAHDEDPLGQTPELELADEQAGHDGLAGPGVVGEQEPHAGELHEVFVDRLQLMG